LSDNRNPQRKGKQVNQERKERRVYKAVLNMKPVGRKMHMDRVFGHDMERALARFRNAQKKGIVT
jgi:hypothetical protein